MTRWEKCTRTRCRVVNLWLFQLQISMSFDQLLLVILILIVKYDLISLICRSLSQCYRKRKIIDVIIWCFLIFTAIPVCWEFSRKFAMRSLGFLLEIQVWNLVSRSNFLISVENQFHRIYQHNTFNENKSNALKYIFSI